MTVGKDVSALFPDVVNCMQTDNLELKKLVYLYLMNYAKTQPDMAIMAVNTFVKVSVVCLFRCVFGHIRHCLYFVFSPQGFANIATGQGKPFSSSFSSSTKTFRICSFSALVCSF